MDGKERRMRNNVSAHSTAIVDTDQVGAGTRIWAFTHIMDNAVVGANCNIGEHCFIESGAVIGDNVTIKNQTMIWEGVTINDGVFVGPNVTFTNDLFPRSARLPQAAGRYADRGWLSKTRVNRGASIGAAAVVLPNITVGEFAMIGAGAVVTKDVAPHALMIGSPARRTGWVCECGQLLRFTNERAVCDHCNRGFSRRGDGISRSDSQR
jgi:UDP-2-acetamido-3-amino-2,3-dideoxy-glucuronate N-acetyltransferase